MSTTSPRRHHDDSTSRLVSLGITGFAGVMLATIALFQILEGIAAVSEDAIYVTGADYVYALDVTTWGWIHLIVGVIGFATGIGILAGQTWGRMAGIVIAVLGALVNFAFLPYFPLWSLVILAFNGLVLWALCTQVDRGTTI